MENNFVKDQITNLIIIILGSIICFTFFFLGGSHYEEKLRKDAIVNGVAEWVSSEDGSVEFRWIAPRSTTDKE